MESTDIVIFGDFKPKGGIQRFLANLIKDWVRYGYTIELVSYRNGKLFYPHELGHLISFKNLKVNNKILATFKLWRYLLKTKPKVLFSSTHLANKIVSYLNYLPKINTKRFIIIQNNFVQSQRKERSQHLRKLHEVKRLYKLNNGVITASEGIRKDLKNYLGITDVPIHVIWNGAITEQNLARAKEPVNHPWLKNTRQIPVILSVGGLRKQKDHKTLIDAIARVHRKQDCRLIILGEGPLREELDKRAREQGIKNSFDMPGFSDNPYAWMQRVDCFALSSLWEGFGIVLAEALSLGVPIVSTDCPSGPREILQDGIYGKLVPMGDSEALAKAIERTLDGDIEQFDPAEAVEKFTARYASRRYLEVFGLLEKEASK